MCLEDLGGPSTPGHSCPGIHRRLSPSVLATSNLCFHVQDLNYLQVVDSQIDFAITKIGSILPSSMNLYYFFSPQILQKPMGQVKMMSMLKEICSITVAKEMEGKLSVFCFPSLSSGDRNHIYAAGAPALYFQILWCFSTVENSVQIQSKPCTLAWIQSMFERFCIFCWND